MLMLKNLLLVCLPIVVICFPFVVYYVSVRMGIAPVSMFVYSKCVSCVGNPCRCCFDRSHPVVITTARSVVRTAVVVFFSV